MTPINFRPPPTDPLLFDLCNKFAIFPVNLPLSLDFKTGVQAVKREFNKIKNSYASIGMYFMAVMVMSFPKPISYNFVKFFSQKPTIFATNVYMGNSPFYIGGYKSRKCTTFVPVMLDATGGFAIVSHSDTLWVTFSCDIARCQDGKQIIKLFEGNLD